MPPSMPPDSHRTLDLTTEPVDSISPSSVLERVQPQHFRILMTEPQLTRLRQKAVATLPGSVSLAEEAPREAPRGAVARVAHAWIVQSIR